MRVRPRNLQLAFGALALSSAVVISACGGGDSSNDSGNASATAGTTGATGATSAGVTGSSGAAGPTRKRSKRAAGDKKRKSQSGGSSPTGSGGDTAGGSANNGAGKGPPHFGTYLERELYREAKIVCAALSLPGLAHEYEVKRTPEAVARAYAKGYAPNSRGAVYLGCKAAFTKR
jgi:hypothetical protein